MVELKDRQQQEMEGKLQFHSRLMLLVQVLVPCWNQTHVRIFESLQLEGLYVGDFCICPVVGRTFNNRDVSWRCRSQGVGF